MAQEPVVIVGAGHSGFQLAASLRQHGYEGAITLIGDETVLPYQRPPLSKDYLDGKIGLDLLLMRPETFYRDHRIDYLPGTRVSEIDRAAKRVHLASGERLLFRTRNSDHCWKTDQFQTGFVAIAPEAAEYLAARQVRTVGVDYLSIGPYQSGGPETHRALLGAGVWVIEGLNLELVEPGDYELVCLPLKIVGADGAPARAILRKL